MTTVINNPGGSSDGGNGMGMIVGVIVLLVVLALVFFYGLPYLRGSSSQQSAPTIQVPDQVDINVQKAP